MVEGAVGDGLLLVGHDDGHAAVVVVVVVPPQVGRVGVGVALVVGAFRAPAVVRLGQSERPVSRFRPAFSPRGRPATNSVTKNKIESA